MYFMLSNKIWNTHPCRTSKASTGTFLDSGDIRFGRLARPPRFRPRHRGWMERKLELKDPGRKRISRRYINRLFQGIACLHWEIDYFMISRLSYKRSTQSWNLSCHIGIPIRWWMSVAFFSQSEVVGVDFHTPHGWEEALKGRPVNLLDSFPIHPKGSFHGRAFNLPWDSQHWPSQKMGW